MECCVYNSATQQEISRGMGQMNRLIIILLLHKCTDLSPRGYITSFLNVKLIYMIMYHI